jgi:hypothetical protein
VSLPVAAFDAAFSISSVAAALLAGCFLPASLKLRGAHTKMFSTFSVQFRLNLPPQFEFFRGAGASFFHHASHSHGDFMRGSRVVRDCITDFYAIDFYDFQLLKKV